MTRSMNIREVILNESVAQRPSSATGAALTQTGVLEAVFKELGRPRDIETQEAVLTQWHELFCTGYFAWGLDLTNPNPPFFHFTERGRRALERLSRDPGNPSGYQRYLSATAKLSSITQSYVGEALACYVADLHKAAAVMIGAAAESLIVELRDGTVQRLTTSGLPIPKGLADWRVKTILSAEYALLVGRKAEFPIQLREEFEAYWLAFAQQIRATRNDAGHPSNVEIISEDAVHASLLVFPELARLSSGLTKWVQTEMKWLPHLTS